MCHYMGQEDIWKHTSEAKVWLGVSFFCKPVDLFCGVYDKKNKSDSQKYIRLPLLYFLYARYEHCFMGKIPRLIPNRMYSTAEGKVVYFEVKLVHYDLQLYFET